MGIITQLRQFITGTQIYPITKSGAVYDDSLGRLDTVLSGTKDTLNSQTTQINSIEQQTELLLDSVETLGARVDFIGTQVGSFQSQIDENGTDLESHTAQKATGSTFGHTVLSDLYSSTPSNNKAKGCQN